MHVSLKSFVLTATVVTSVFFPSPFFGATNEFAGATGGSWNEDANWSLEHRPTTDDDVLIPSGKTVTSTESIVAGSLTISGGKLQLGTPVTGTDQRNRPHVSATIAGDVTLTGAAKLEVIAGEIQDLTVFEDRTASEAAIRAAANVVTIGGNFTVDGTSVVYPEAAELTGVPVHFKVTGDVTIAEGATFDTRKRGWGWSSGDWATRPVTNNVRSLSAEKTQRTFGWSLAYGAGWDRFNSANYGAAGQSYVYGYSFAPFLPGSPGGNYYAKDKSQIHKGRGPGAIVILAHGDMTVNGQLLADARIPNDSGTDSSGMSGGGIWLAANSFTFGANAKLSAEGGKALTNGYFPPGRGGRIALAECPTDEELATMMTGTLPDSLVESATIEGVTTSVLGGYNYAGTSRTSSGTLSTVRSKYVSATLTTRQTTGENLVADGITWGDCAILNGEQSFVAPEFAYLTTDAGVRYSYAGFIVSNATSLVAENSDRSVRTATWTSFGAQGPYSLTWKWDTREIRVTGSISGVGAITVDGVEHDASFEQWIASGKSFTCVPVDDTAFAYWAGTAVPGGYSAAKSLTCAFTEAKTLVAAFATESVSRRWVGASNASWFALDSWEPTGAPTPIDDVYLTNATVAVSSALAVNSLTIAGSSKVTFNAVGFTEESTASNLYARATPVTVAEKLEISGSAVVTVANDAASGAAVRLDVKNFLLGENATVTASEKGWAWQAGTNAYQRFRQGDAASGYWWTSAMGPGGDTSSSWAYNKGAGHGAIGGNGTAGGFGGSYGYKYAPFLPGSPNGCYNWPGEGKNYSGPGGGTVWIVCSGLCELNGTITANGMAREYGTPSGGGVWIAAKGIKAGPSASISAMGGTMPSCNYGSLGAGGRVSLAIGLTAAERDELAAGKMPDELGLEASDTIDLLAVDVRGGLKKKNSTYGPAGTATTVVGSEGFINVIVTGSPIEALGVDPVNGVNAFEGGVAQTFTAPAYGVDPSDANVRYPCLGYVVTNSQGEAVSGSGCSVSVMIEKGEPISVTWLWGAAEKRALVRKPANGTLTVNGEPVDGDAVNWTTLTTASLAVVPDYGYEFVCWEGVLPLGCAKQNPLVADLSKPLDVTPVLREAEAPTTRTWSGTGDWKDATKWEPAGNIPGAGDTIVVMSGTCTFSNALVAARLEMTNGTLKVGTTKSVNAEIDVTGDALLLGGTLTLGTGARMDYASWRQPSFIVDPKIRWQGHGRLAVGGDLALSGTAKLEAFGGPIEGEYTFASGASSVEVGKTLVLADSSKLTLFSDFITGGSVKIRANDVSIAEKAKVDAAGKGFMGLDVNTQPNAPGIGFDYSVGASHGGIGGGNGAGSVYDFKLAPVMPGSPNGTYNNTIDNQRAGGGVVRIHAARTLSLDGTIDANAETNEVAYGGASGGSIWLTAERFAFGATSLMTAMGSYVSAYGSDGGGGRIAIGCHLSEAQIDSLAETGAASGVTERQQLETAAFAELYPGCTVTVAGGDAGEGRAGTFVYRRPSNALVIVVR